MRTRVGMLAFVVGVGMGCVELPKWPEAPKPPAPAAPAAVTKSVKPAPITADQINEDNAKEKARALRQELDRNE